MANEFLKLKWKKSFRTADINKDNVLTLEDADVFSENFARFHNMNAEDAEKVKRDNRTFYREWVLRRQDKVDEKTFLENMVKAYLEDEAKFRAHTKQYFSLIMNIVWRVMAKSWDFKTFDRKFMKAFPLIMDRYISLDVYLNGFVEFICNPDKNNIKVEKPFHYGFGLIDEEPEQFDQKTTKTNHDCKD